MEPQTKQSLLKTIHYKILNLVQAWRCFSNEVKYMSQITIRIFFDIQPNDIQYSLRYLPSRLNTLTLNHQFFACQLFKLGSRGLRFAGICWESHQNRVFYWKRLLLTSKFLSRCQHWSAKPSVFEPPLYCLSTMP